MSKVSKIIKLNKNNKNGDKVDLEKLKYKIDKLKEQYLNETQRESKYKKK